MNIVNHQIPHYTHIKFNNFLRIFQKNAVTASIKIRKDSCLNQFFIVFDQLCPKCNCVGRS